ncbi:MAG TPA: ribonuclease Y [Candidatus Coprosoma intestinipullorum]|uniref:Ribonuclease Y n=1 Tax=Candidatus Coprosoma intestinipullorum TaxID=2840752 RepID=A0A9D1CYM3_9FIRM|nr:ribonuclease Y [Candidatus Coprosoma intestinipullorum]
MVFSILLVLIGLFVGIIFMMILNSLKVLSATKKADKLLEDAEIQADKLKRDSILEAKEENHRLKADLDKEIKEKKAEIKESEDRLLAREESIDRRDQTLQNREQILDSKEQDLIDKQKDIQKEQVELENTKNEQIKLLEKIAGYSKEEAKDEIMKKVENMMNLEIASYIKDREAEAKLEVDKNAKNMLVTAMQRYAGDVAGEQTVTVVTLPNDEMKGRIIGREGRNIKTIEAVTGVDLIIDDTPEAIVLSSFDPYRREIARLTIEALIKDGRIHPSRIEEVYDKTASEMKAKLMEYGNDALFELGLTKVAPELVEALGKLHFRTSYGQNVLKHCVEVGHLTGLLAAELGENVTLAKRAGLFHDIGKSIDHEAEGSHVELGLDLVTKYGENEVVRNTVASHHGDCEPTSVIAVLATIADALSASRPGARNDSLENYIKRLTDLENIANEMDGVEKAYAVQAGRELRVIVKPSEIDDLQSHKLARDIKKGIEEKLQYPGTIKVVVIRETRVIEEAK